MKLIIPVYLVILYLFSREGNFLYAQTLTITDQRTEGLTNPISVDTHHPRFSWIYFTSMNNTNTPTIVPYVFPYQYRLVLAYNSSSLIRNQNLLWDTGIVPTNTNSTVSPSPTTTVLYNGTYAFESTKDYVWRVDANICTNHTLTVPSSSSLLPSPTLKLSCQWINGTIVPFGMGLLTPTDWHQAQWINGYSQMRTMFTLDNTTAIITRARLYITAVGLYTLYMNGRYINQEQPLTNPNSSLVGTTLPMVLLPGYSTVYSTRILYNTFDITSYLQNENVIGVRIGSGKYGYLTEFCMEGPAICNGILALVLVESVNTQGIINYTWIPTSTLTWYGSVSPIIYEHLYIGEIYNASLEQINWNNPGPWNVSLWSSVTSMAIPPTGTLNTHTMTSISIINTSGPILFQSVNSSMWFIDTGINNAGLFSFTIAGPVQPNVTIRIALGERTKVLPDTNATVMVNVFPCPSPCCPKGGGCSSMIYEYITKASTEPQTYTPSFSTGGYRYALLSIVNNDSTDSLLSSWPGSRLPIASDFQRHSISSAIESGGNLSFSSLSTEGSLLQRIHGMVLQSQISNAVSHATDCPHRERRGWGGDSSVTVSEATINFRLQAFYENSARTQTDTQSIGCGNFTTGNTCGVFHDSLNPFTIQRDGLTYLKNNNQTSRVSSFVDSFRNGPNERPDCYLCCPVERSEGGDFGCAYFNSMVTGSLPDILPVNGPSRSWPGSITWTSVAVTLPDALLRNYGDTVGVQNSFSTVYSLLSFYSTVASQNSSVLLPYEFYGDWIALEPTTKLYYGNAYYAYTTYLGSVMASSIGNSTEAAALLALSSLINNELSQIYLNSSTGIWDTGSQAALSSALWMNLGGSKGQSVQPQVLTNLVHNVANQHNYTVTVGTLGSRTILQALTEFGASDTALSLAVQTNAPSWGWFLMTNNSGGEAPFLGQAVGTLWEEWNSSQSSLNHVMLGGGIGEWVWESALGLRLRYTAEPIETLEEINQGYACLSQLDGINDDPLSKNGFLSTEICAARYALQRLQQEFIPTERFRLSVPYLALLQKYVKDYYVRMNKRDSMRTLPRTMVPRVSVILEEAFVRRIGRARGSRITPAGLISLDWRYSTDAKYLDIHLSLPSLVPGTVAIPNHLLALRSSTLLRVTSKLYGTVRQFTIQTNSTNTSSFVTFTIDELTPTDSTDPCLFALTYGWITRSQVYHRKVPVPMDVNVPWIPSVEDFLQLSVPLGLDYRIELR